MPTLIIKAGPTARRLIERDGFTPELFSHMGAAAGGPKWLILNRLDRALFGEWFKPRKKSLTVVGASIGNWRMACAAQRDPVAAIERFEAAYLSQRYGLKPSPREVSEEAWRILRLLLGENGGTEILSHPRLRLNVVTARCRGWIGSETPFLQKTALLGALVSNLASRRLLGLWLQRVILHSPAAAPVALRDDGFATQYAPLTADNLEAALMASASIPMALAPVRDIPGAPTGVYLDGGMIDYHMDLSLCGGMDLPLRDGTENLLFLPHFCETVTTGWLDKFLPWRKPENLGNVVLVAPSQEFLATLPNGKVPDRHDFWLYAGRDDERIRDWKIAVAEGQRMADEFPIYPNL